MMSSLCVCAVAGCCQDACLCVSFTVLRLGGSGASGCMVWLQAGGVSALGFASLRLRCVGLAALLHQLLPRSARLERLCVCCNSTTATRTAHACHATAHNTSAHQHLCCTSHTTLAGGPAAHTHHMHAAHTPLLLHRCARARYASSRLHAARRCATAVHSRDRSDKHGPWAARSYPRGAPAMNTSVVFFGAHHACMPLVPCLHAGGVCFTHRQHHSNTNSAHIHIHTHTSTPGCRRTRRLNMPPPAAAAHLWLCLWLLWLRQLAPSSDAACVGSQDDVGLLHGLLDLLVGQHHSAVHVELVLHTQAQHRSA